MHGGRHIKVDQTEGPGGVKFYSIKVKQKSPKLRRPEHISSGFNLQHMGTMGRRNTIDKLNETFRVAEEDINSPGILQGGKLVIGR